jgi:hypothetical protein
MPLRTSTQFLLLDFHVAWRYSRHYGTAVSRWRTHRIGPLLDFSNMQFLHILDACVPYRKAPKLPR